MAKTTLFKGIVYLSQEQYNKLIALGAIEINGKVIEYDESILYVTPQTLPDDYYTKEQTKELIKTQVISGDEFIIVDEGEPGTINEGKTVIELDRTNIETVTATEASKKLITSGAVFNSISHLEGVSGGERTFEMTGTFNEIRDKVFELSPKYIDIKVQSDIYATLPKCTITANEDGSLSNIAFSTENISVLNSSFLVRFYREIGADSLGGVVTKRYTVTWDDRTNSRYITTTLYLSKAGVGIPQIDCTINNKMNSSSRQIVNYGFGSNGDVGEQTATAILYY